MKCPICEGIEFTNLDYLRTKAEGFCICQNCGFITYEKSEKEITDMYKVSAHNAVRKFAGTNDLNTKFHKLPYHKRMLHKHLSKTVKPKNLLDYGCSTGYILNWIKENYAYNVTGIELNPAHAEYGRREYGLDIHEVAKLSELPDQDKKYDLIINFAVLEHIVDPVTALKEMREHLSDDGIIYLMTPVWFKSLYDSDWRIKHFEELFVPHHINVFSEISRNNCFKLAGLEIIERTDAMYGDIVILKKCPPSDDIEKENAKKMIVKISEYKQAIEAMFKQDYATSLALVPNNPEVYYIKAMKEKDNVKEHERLLNKSIEVMPNYAKLYENKGIFHLQTGEYKKAIELFNKAIELCPNQYQAYWNLSEIAYIKKDYDLAIKHISDLIEVNPLLEHKSFNKDSDTVRDRLGQIYAVIASEKNDTSL